MNYDQLLFSELRLVAVSFDTAPLTEENLVKAMTVNKELLALGYTLSPKDIVILAQSADADGLAARGKLRGFAQHLHRAAEDLLILPLLQVCHGVDQRAFGKHPADPFARDKPVEIKR